MGHIAERADGIVLRTATPDDVDQIIAMSIDAHGAHYEWGFRTVMADPTAGLDRWVVAADGDRIVSTLCLMQEAFDFGHGVQVGIGRPEYVATLAEYRRRRLVRDQLDVVHRWSEERGDLAQMILGIDYFYRRFGYEHAADYLHFWTVDGAVEMPAGWTVRRATTDDIPELGRLRRAATTAAGVSLVFTDRAWRQMVDDDPLHGHHVLLAEHPTGGRASAYVQYERDDEPARVTQVGADRLDGVRALIAHMQQLATKHGVTLAQRPGTLSESFLHDHGRPMGKSTAIYLRIADPVAFLDRLRPVLSARLAASPLAAECGEVEISLFTPGIRITYDRGAVTAVEACDGAEDPDDVGKVGVPPDQIATLVMGRYGALELERRHQDVHLHRARAAMAVLFPPVVPDLATPT